MVGCIGYQNIFYKMFAFIVNAESSSDTKENENTCAKRILDTYGDSILRLSYSYVHNMSDAEEILQDTIIKYLRHKPSLDSETHEKAWLLKVASNLSKNRIQYNALRRTDELDITLSQKEREDLSFIWDAVKSLPHKYREVIHLFYCEGYSVAEISEILDRKPSTVKSELSRGREKLKTILREEYDFE